jgi:DNA-directed RNA polymerase subunit RPC12/RpoP
LSRNGKTKMFSCAKCGAPFEAFPPDDLHSIATRLEKEATKDNVIAEYKCRDCGKVNTIYWVHTPP